MYLLGNSFQAARFWSHIYGYIDVYCLLLYTLALKHITNLLNVHNYFLKPLEWSAKAICFYHYTKHFLAALSFLNKSCAVASHGFFFGASLIL